MSTIRNLVTLIGNAGADPEIRTFSNGQKVARFRIAVNESYKNANGEWVQVAQWFPCVGFASVAERIEKQIRKGVCVSIEGRLHNNEWNDDKGQRHTSTEVIVNDFFLVEKQKNQ